MIEPNGSIVVAGHICVDLHVQIESDTVTGADLVVPGKLVEVGPAQLTTGGAVANTGLALHRLGFPVRLAGKVGADVLGRATLDVLRSHEGRLGDGMIVSENDQSSYTVVISPPGVDRSFLHYPGANHTFSAADLPNDRLHDALWLHFGYPPLMRRIYENDGAELVNILQRAREAGLVTSLDMALPDPQTTAGKLDWQDWLANVLPHVDVFLPSLDETLYMLDRPRFEELMQAAYEVDEALPRTVAGRLMELGVGVVGLKLGDAGLYVQATEEQGALARLERCGSLDAAEWCGCQVRKPCFAVDVCGTTGAGDATIAGFIAAVYQGLSPEQAATMAVAVGACSVEAPDAVTGVPAWNAVAERVDAGWAVRR